MRFSRTEKLIGEEKLAILRSKKVAVFGLGGVGGILAEALARSGVGCLALVDKDVVDESNLNRQIIATEQSLGKSKAEAMKERVLSIGMGTVVTAFEEFYLPENADFINLAEYDYVVDAIDNVTAKIELISRCKVAGVPIICAMGAGNKLDPTRVKIADISKTHTCPLAKIVRKKLSDRGISGVKVAFSDEPSVSVSAERAPSSMMPVPAVMGLIMAAEVIKDLIG